MKALLFFAFMCIGIGGAVQWSKVNPQFGIGRIVNFISDGSTTVMVQIDDNTFEVQIYYSTDNSHEWKYISIVNSSDISARQYVGSCYINSQFMIFLSGNVSLVSQDGSQFTAVPGPKDLYIVSIITTRSGSLLLAALEYLTNRLFLSTDGVTWNNAIVPVAYIIDLTATSDFFIIFADNNNYYVSQDGTTWSLMSHFTNEHKLDFYGGQRNELIAAAASGLYNSSLYSSKDNGKTWKWVLNVTASVNDITYACGYYALVTVFRNSNDPIYELAISKDLVHWTPIPDQHPLRLFPVNDVVYAVANVGFAITSDYQHWDVPDIGLVRSWQSIYVLQDGSFIFEARGVQFYRSVNGTTFSLQPPPPFDDHPPAPAYLSQWTSDWTFYFFDGTKLYSTVDFALWAVDDANAPVECTHYGQSWFDYLVHGNGGWVGICIDMADLETYANIYISQTPTGGWKQVFTSGPLHDLPTHSIAFNNGVFVYQLDGVVYTSANGLNWTIPNNQPHPYLTSHVSALGNWILMIQQGLSLIYSISKDGNQWRNLSLPIRNPTLKYVNEADLYVAYGLAVNLQGKAATSPDGITWMLNDGFSLPEHEMVTDMEYNGKIWAAADNEAGIYIGHP